MDDLLLLIPARAGSKGLLNKNTRPMLGKPLIQYTMEAALGAGLGGRVLVSSDDPEVQAIARSLGLAVLERPAHLAQDDTTMNAVIRHAWETHPSRHMMVLYPTAPLRDAVHIREAWSLYEQSGQGTLISVTELKTAPWGGVMLHEDGRLNPLAPQASFYRRQDMPTLYRANGAIYIFDQDTFPQLSNMLTHDKTIAFVMDNDRSVDVDTLIDFAQAEFLLKEGYVSLRSMAPAASTGN